MPAVDSPMVSAFKRKFQIFVSSTLEDLKEERRQVIETVLGLGHFPVGMELFQAGNEEQWAYIQRQIDECDYYLVIVAERYGATTADGMSYTEKEYRHARERGIPLAALLLDATVRQAWPSGKCESNRRSEISAFRALCEGRVVKYWRDGGDLAAKCALALAHLFHDYPRDGWVPASQAVSPEVVGELARLSRDNDSLRRRVSQLETDEQSSRRVEALVARLGQLRLWVDGDGPREVLFKSVQPGGILLRAQTALALGATQQEVEDAVCQTFFAVAGSNTPAPDVGETTLQLLVDLTLLGIVDTEVRKEPTLGFPFTARPREEMVRRWTLTALGKEVVSKLRWSY